MPLKDYYKTLEISPAASEQEIKRSFRRLVHRFHPDKNAGDAAVAARFREIREAYEILSDPQQREEYHYKRWYNRSLGKQFHEAPLTPRAVLHECERLYNYLMSVGLARVDYDALSYHIRQLLSDDNTRMLQQAHDSSTNRLIVQKLAEACHDLPWRYIAPIAALLQQVAAGDAATEKDISAFITMHRQNALWRKYRAGIVIGITLLLCWLIYTIGK